jgi:hypothetical protein
VLQELTPGKRNSFSFIEGNVNGRDLFVATRKPAAKRAPRRKKRDDGEETPKRGRPKKRDGTATPGELPATPQRKSPPKKATSQPEEIEVEPVKEVDMLDGTETSQADVEEATQIYSQFADDDGFELSGYEIETPTQNPLETPTRSPRDESPLPVQPYRSFHSSPPPSPVYEEYQVPIPTSSSPARASVYNTPFIAHPKSRIETPAAYDQMRRRRARSRSASRERRMSIAPIPQWKGLPSTPRRSVSEDADVMDVDQGSTSTGTTDIRSPMVLPTFEVRQTIYNESMTPIRNWAAEIAEGAFRSDKSPSKIVQLPIASQVPTIPPVTVQDEEEYYSEENNITGDNKDQIDKSEDFSVGHYSVPPFPPKTMPQITRLRESPIVITSSPPQEPPQIHYQWKTIVDSSSPAPVSELDSDSEPDLSTSQCRISSLRQSSPARSILTDLGDDVIDISSMSPLAAKRAANILLKSQCYSKITFDDEEGQKIWQDAQDQAGEYELNQLELSNEQEEEDTDEEEEVEEEVQEEEEAEEDAPPALAGPSRISHGEWTKLDWKRMEKCLNLTEGEMNDAIDLFLQRYIGRERDEVEMRCRALLLTRRRRVLEGRKVGFILSTNE